MVAGLSSSFLGCGKTKLWTDFFRVLWYTIRKSFPLSVPQLTNGLNSISSLPSSTPTGVDGGNLTSASFSCSFSIRILELVDAAVPQQELEPHRQTILKVEGVKGCHRLRGRRAGSFLYLDVHIEVDPFTSVSDAHYVGETVRHQLHESHREVSEVFIHIDPAVSEALPDAANLQDVWDGADPNYVDSSSEQKDLHDNVSNIFVSKFTEKVVVERITRHVLQGKIFLEIEVSMPPDTLIQNAIEMAEEARKDILEMVPNIIEVSIQLRLSQSNHKAS